MSDDSNDGFENDSNYVLYKNRPEWNDVTPVKQDDGPDAIVAIDYSEVFEDAFDYFRAVVQNQEMSDRALELTATCVDLNPANYTVWQYRRDILKALKKDLYEELAYSEKIILNHEKNYQVWHHRKVLIEWLKDPAKEKQLTERALEKEEKNYHAWQHRQWVLKTFNLFDGELDYVDKLLNNDVRNNSAWNQRYFVINNTTGFTEEVLNRELDYTLNRLNELIENESAWNYLRGLLLHDKEGLSNNPKVRNFCEELYQNGNRSALLLAAIVDICYELVGNDVGDKVYNLERGLELCHELETKVDTIRAKYWTHMAEMLKQKREERPAAMNNNKFS